MASVSSFSLFVAPSPTSAAISLSLMFMSCPLSAFVAGVNIGSGSLSDSRSPGGRLTPQTSPVF